MAEAGCDRVLWTVTDGVADVRLNRPDKLNALDDEMFEALLATAAALYAHEGLRAVVLSGNGRACCAGLDLGAFRAMAEGRPFHPADADARSAAVGVGGDADLRGQRVVLRFRTRPVPVIAAVGGPALGRVCSSRLSPTFASPRRRPPWGCWRCALGDHPDMTGPNCCRAWSAGTSRPR